MSDQPSETKARFLELVNLPPHAGEAFAGSPAFVAYCYGGEMRAKQRRDGLLRARRRFRKAVEKDTDTYSGALLLIQRSGLAFEDLARLGLALEVIGEGDPFESLRGRGLDGLDSVYLRLSNDDDRFRTVFRLPTQSDLEDFDLLPREALLEVSTRLEKRWHAQWREAEVGWLSAKPIMKAMRHGTPLIPREIVIDPPGSGLLGMGLTDLSARWVLLASTSVDDPNQNYDTKYEAFDLSNAVVNSIADGAEGAVSLARAMSASHIKRVASGCKWAFPSKELKSLTPDQARVIRETSI